MHAIQALALINIDVAMLVLLSGAFMALQILDFGIWRRRRASLNGPRGATRHQNISTLSVS